MPVNLSAVEDPVQVDEHGGIRLQMLTPGDYYQPEVVSTDEIRLRRVSSHLPQQRSFTRQEVMKAIEESELRFTSSWDELKLETRE
jgi:hypothetical protein